MTDKPWPLLYIALALILPIPLLWLAGVMALSHGFASVRSDIAMVLVCVAPLMSVVGAVLLPFKTWIRVVTTIIAVPFAVSLQIFCTVMLGCAYGQCS